MTIKMGCGYFNSNNKKALCLQEWLHLVCFSPGAPGSPQTHGPALKSGCALILVFFSPFYHHCVSVIQLEENNLCSFGNFQTRTSDFPCSIPGNMPGAWEGARPIALFYHEWGEERYFFWLFFFLINFILRTVLDLQKTWEDGTKFSFTLH